DVVVGRRRIAVVILAVVRNLRCAGVHLGVAVVAVIAAGLDGIVPVGVDIGQVLVVAVLVDPVVGHLVGPRVDGAVVVVAVDVVVEPVGIEVVVRTRGIAVVVLAVVGDLGRSRVDGRIVVVTVAPLGRVAVVVLVHEVAGQVVTGAVLVDAVAADLGAA